MPIQKGCSMIDEHGRRRGGLGALIRIWWVGAGVLIAVAACGNPAPDPAPDPTPGAVERNADRLTQDEEAEKQAKIGAMDARARRRSEAATARVDAIEKERRPR